MNFLAHAYLSFNNPDLLVGNMISDFVKGKKKFDYSEGIQKGIALHRAIDTFTDDHLETKEAKQYLKEAVGLYSGAFIDIVYDHFLASDSSQFTEDSLEEFCDRTYQTLKQYEHVLPSPFQQMLPYMTSQNWLFNYRNLWGAERSFAGLVRRAKYIDDSAGAFATFQKNYQPLQKCYIKFFPSVKRFAEEYVQTL